MDHKFNIISNKIDHYVRNDRNSAEEYYIGDDLDQDLLHQAANSDFNEKVKDIFTNFYKAAGVDSGCSNMNATDSVEIAVQTELEHIIDIGCQTSVQQHSVGLQTTSIECLTPSVTNPLTMPPSVTVPLWSILGSTVEDSSVRTTSTRRPTMQNVEIANSAARSGPNRHFALHCEWHSQAACSSS